jgi:hypothetical protein
MKKKTYKLIVTEDERGRVEVEKVSEADEVKHKQPSKTGRGKWKPIDKRKFTRGVLNTIETFKTK